MKKIAIFGLIALFVVGIFATGVSAFGGRGNGAMQEALEEGNYNKYIEGFNENDRGFMRHQLSEEEFNDRLERRALGEEHRDSVRLAIEQEDYDAWILAMGESPRGNNFAEFITEDNFDEFIQMHEARMSGDYDTALELSEDLGIEMFGRHGKQGGNHAFRGNNGCMN